MKWDEMDARAKDALVAEKIFGWESGLCDGEMGEQPCSSDGWFCQKCGHEGYWGDSFEHEQIPPHYTTSMDAAWLVMQQMGARFNPKDIYAYEPFISFTNELFGTENEELHPSYRYMGEQIAKWTPDRICQAALRAVGEIKD